MKNEPLTRNRIYRLAQAEANILVTSITSRLAVELNTSDADSLRKAISENVFWAICSSRTGQERLKAETDKAIQAIRDRKT